MLLSQTCQVGIVRLLIIDPSAGVRTPLKDGRREAALLDSNIVMLTTNNSLEQVVLV